MLSDEEKQAIEGLKGSQKWTRQQIRLGNLPNYNQGHYADIEIVLNLIEKQSKEIEELKAINKMQKYRIEVIDEREFISKDTIKSKIEEVDKDENASIPDFIEYAKEYATQKLQSLLEKE